MLMYAVAVMSLAAQSPAGPEPVASESPAMAAARENVARVKTRAAFKSGPEADFAEAARAAGEFGKVTVAGIIGPHGRFSELAVVDSSRSPRLDASALAAAAETVFEPARNEAGEPLADRARMPFEFTNAKSPGKGGGALRYKCDQFARDEARMVRSTLGKFGSANEDFDARWKAAVETCRSKPDRVFIDVFKPEGDLLRRMAGG